MKLYKALKLKSKLIGEISDLQSKILNKNSYIKGTVRHFNISILLKDYNSKKEDLVKLKIAINKANLGIQEEIYRLAELKDTLRMWKGMNYTEGLSSPNGRYGTEVHEYEVVFNEKICNEKVIEYEEMIEATQELIDQFNYTVDVEY